MPEVLHVKGLGGASLTPRSRKGPVATVEVGVYRGLALGRPPVAWGMETS